jgi:protein SCO1/2
MQGVGVDEKIGSHVDLDLTFTAENGYRVPLRSFFHKDRPVVLNLVYYECPMLCNLVLNGEVASFRELAWTPGDQFEVVTISINPEEGFDLAQKKKSLYLTSYGRPAPGWHFLVDDQGHAKQLAEQAGFHYKYDERQKQYAHAAAIMLLTPDGKMSRYLYGIKFKARDLRLGLTEASAGRGGVSLQKVLLFCFHYDPKVGSYVLFATNFMRIGGALSAAVLGIALVRLWRKERSQVPV